MNNNEDMKIISYTELVSIENVQVQKGMNFGIKKSYSIVLMSIQKNAPYNDRLLDNGIIEYEGHDAVKSHKYNKKMVDQPLKSPAGSLTENGKFFKAAEEFKDGKRDAAKIKVYRKIKRGVWVDMGFYTLIDAFIEKDVYRQVCKFLLKPNYEEFSDDQDYVELEHNRQIPGDVQREVYERDKGKCKQCGSTENLHFDHILPFSKGGSSKTADNIQLLCAKHNLKKSDKFISIADVKHKKDDLIERKLENISKLIERIILIGGILIGLIFCAFIFLN